MSQCKHWRNHKITAWLTVQDAEAEIPDEKANICTLSHMENANIDFPPEHKNFISSTDALINQVEKQNHLGRVLQNTRLVVGHDIFRLKQIDSEMTSHPWAH